MDSNYATLLGTAATIGFLHTILGPDHYLPFIVMSKSKQWSMARTAFITMVSGVGHVAGSIILGLIGVSLGLALNRLESIESIRGDLAAWLLIIFGLGYMAWGILFAIRNKPHSHTHLHDGEEHDHHHEHLADHGHVHEVKGRKLFSPWALFIIFVFGPCEALIPLLMYPAAEGSISGVLSVAALFALTTIATMLAAVLIGSYGLALVPTRRLERYTHAAAGATILLCGLSIQFLGL